MFGWHFECTMEADVPPIWSFQGGATPTLVFYFFLLSAFWPTRTVAKIPLTLLTPKWLNLTVSYPHRLCISVTSHTQHSPAYLWRHFPLAPATHKPKWRHRRPFMATMTFPLQRWKYCASRGRRNMRTNIDRRARRSGDGSKRRWLWWWGGEWGTGEKKKTHRRGREFKEKERGRERLK